MAKTIPLIFIDADVLIDLLTGRVPFAYDAADLFQLIADQKCRGCISSLTLLNTHYLLKKFMSEDQIRHHLHSIMKLVEVMPVGANEVGKALDSDWSDFEDAVQYFTAISAQAESIITRNKKDFLKSTIPVFSASTYSEKF